MLLRAERGRWQCATFNGTEVRTDTAQTSAKATAAISVNPDRHGQASPPSFRVLHMDDLMTLMPLESPDDILRMIEEIHDVTQRAHLMQRLCEHPLTPRTTILMILDDPEILGRIGSVDQWIDYPARLRAGWMIASAVPGQLAAEHLIPPHLQLSRHQQEYLLGWAFEEGKLSARATEYFARNFSGKYEMLKAIRHRATLDDAAGR